MNLAEMGIRALILFAVVIREQVTAYPKGPGCGALLTDAIVGNRIEARTSLNSSFNESHAVLNNKLAILAGFEIQGRSSSSQYVTKFKIRYKDENDQLFKDFPANQQAFTLSPTNGDDIIYISLNGTKMQTIIFYPSQWNGHICMRIELYGCVIVDGGYTPWSDWTTCSNSCGNGTSFRYRSCSNPAPLNGGENCTGESINMKECVGTSCPVDGGFSDWSNWTLCSASCGTGFQLRTRNCSNPLPVHGGKLCDSRNSSEARICMMPVCQQPVDGGFSDWSNWTLCSASCGTGFQLRTRNCSNPLPVHGGKLCDSRNSSEARICMMPVCQQPVDGGFSDWSNWTLCSASCGTGFQLRTRNCSNPLPVHGGKLCDSRNSSEARICMMPVCQQPGAGDPAARSDDGQDENKYFIPMVVLAVAFAIFIAIAVAVICIMRQGSKHN
ncbi:hypothetical protein OS493_029450, partial [Desmophyllum pertusum]